MNWLKEKKLSEKTKQSEWKKVNWRSPSNIALIKYWGKNGKQLPMNPSISFSLSKSYTDTTVYYKKKERQEKEIDFKYLFEAKENPDFSNRINIYLQSLLKDFPFLPYYRLRIESRNSFPHSAGIASSASSMSALALCLCSLERELTGISNQLDFFRKASNVARLGSGSASRSVYGGFNAWGEHSVLKELNNYYAIPLSENIHKIFQNLQDSILIIDKGQKKISSSYGHRLMENHPHRIQRIKEANSHFLQMWEVLKCGGFERFAAIVEAESFAIHNLMESSEPSFSLLKPETYKVISKIESFRNQNKLPLCFTLDAGPNVHLIYPLEIKKEIVNFIESELVEFCSNGFWIDDNMGNGPIRL
ncbi:MAG: diphosphomevalonate decarboxylase [Prolixibacteraceae bacterium]|nr:diphosphomevalonate decarboxylase [Prolixibacteraceae bacterium]MBN2775175.1 diphosphomevalonate decarboxylase [Prolixibacteraceae bacterium]